VQRLGAFPYILGGAVKIENPLSQMGERFFEQAPESGPSVTYPNNFGSFFRALLFRRHPYPWLKLVDVAQRRFQFPPNKD